MRKQPILVLLLLFVVLVVFVFQCTEKYPPAPQKLALSKQNGCMSCHGNAEQLKKVATPLPPKEGDAGEG